MLEQVRNQRNKRSAKFCLDVRNDVNINTKGTLELLLTLNLCKHILTLITCFQGHTVFRKLSQGETFFIIELHILP